MRTSRGAGISVPPIVSFSFGGKVNEDGRDCAIRKDALTSKLLNGCTFIRISKNRRIGCLRPARDRKEDASMYLRQGEWVCIRTPKPVTRTFISWDVGGDVGSIAGSTTIPTSPIVINDTMR